MLVADNRAYDYSRREYLEQLPLEQPQQQPAPKPKKKPKTKTHILSIMFVFSLSVLIIARYAYIAELNFTSRTIKASYNEALKDKADLNVKLMKTVNLQELEKTAIEKLGMQYPNVLTQIVYVNVEAAAANDNDKHKQYHDITEVDENKYIAYAKEVVGNLLKILE